MKKNDIIELNITDTGVSGEGIGKHEGFPFFVKNAVIGDEVEAVITKLKKSYGYAKVLRVKKPGAFRVEPACANAERCGGCQIMQLDYRKQLEVKENKVYSDLTRIGKLELGPGVLEPIIGMLDEAAGNGEGLPVQPLRFRNKIQFPIGRNKEGRTVVGFYAGRTHFIVETDDCPVSAEGVSEIAKAICELADEYDISVYDEKEHKGLLRHVLIRTGFGTGQVMVCLVINGGSLNDEGRKDIDLGAELVESLTGLKLPAIGNGLPQKIVSIDLNINKQRTNVIMGQDTINLYGKGYIEDEISLGGEEESRLSFKISSLSFYQVNPLQTERLYKKAMDFADIQRDEVVWDLYCGIGTISLFAAQKAAKVYGVEIVDRAIEDAKENAAINGITNAEFICGDSADVFSEHAADETVDVVILDPPRKGCSQRLLEAVLKAAPERIVYVSCDPATLARDLNILTNGSEATYKVEKVCPVDMFPHSCHVETVVSLFQPPKNRETIKVDVDVSSMELTITETQHLAIYEEIKRYCQKVHGLKVSTLFISQVKHFHGLEMRRNYNTSKNSEYKRPKCPANRFHAIEDALRHFKMI